MKLIAKGFFLLLFCNKVIDKRNGYKQFESCWMTAINLSKLAAEAAFNAGRAHFLDCVFLQG